MSKPDDIPQDVWDAAMRSAELLNDDYAIGGASVTPVAETIARAIMAATLAERERIALLSEARAGAHDDAMRMGGPREPNEFEARALRSFASDLRWGA